MGFNRAAGGGSQTLPPAPRTQRHPDAVALGVQQPADLGEVAVVPPVVLVHGGLQQEGVLGVEHARDALLRALHEDAGLLGVHVVPHPLVRLVAGVLPERGGSTDKWEHVTGMHTPNQTLLENEGPIS